ncbi:hypothetical protein A2U01_0079770, partial [Trifolium medium]|nr:hypothetical protein [Trifolium medium]
PLLLPATEEKDQPIFIPIFIITIIFIGTLIQRNQLISRINQDGSRTVRREHYSRSSADEQFNGDRRGSLP